MTDDWFTTLLRISPHAPVDLDGPPAAPLVATDDAAEPRDPAPLSERLWTRPLPERAYIGIRVDGTPLDVPAIALRLCAIAIERQVYPVILSTTAASGFEGLGFRIERLPSAPGPERERAEDDLRRFWSLSLIIDAGDIGLLV